ncbi:MAG: hypothetical protein IJ225_02380 [Solobacterium sp.]|nr:hypothetical protein [Solobacterium sp.]
MLKQVSVIAENKKGAVNAVISDISDAGIDFYNVVSNDSPEFGIIRMLCSDPERAVEILKNNGYLTRSDNVLGIVISEEVGSLSRLLSDVSDSYINIDYLYVCYIRNVENPVAILHVHECSEVEECLKGKGYISLDNSSLYK